METLNKKVDASPTKEFFIYMLTRDIDIKPAIVELIDNAIDGAKKIRKNKNYSGLFIKINMSDHQFIIEDNCGGIDIETAQKYAFKFGRPSERQNDSSEYFTGIFGIGMKRALFKLGNKFEVISSTETEYFDLIVDVNEWVKEEEWNFHFEKAETGLHNSQVGTKIIVEGLKQDISSDFDSEYFRNTLIDYVQKYRTVEAENGLTIEINDILINTKREKLLDSEKIRPYTYRIEDPKGTIRIIAGITEKGEPDKAGWYVYCNGRLVLYANRDNLTGWGDGTRKYHPGLAEFRGYVYFESKNLLDLPWNTTKTGVDTSNRLYVMAKQKMIEAMTQIIRVTEAVKKRHDVTDLKELGFVKNTGERELTYSSVAEIKKNTDFSIAEPETVIPMTTISFSKPTSQYDKVKENLGVKTKKAVGEKLFEYYFEMEAL